MEQSTLNRATTEAVPHDPESAPAPSAPRETLSLDGEWRFRTDPEAPWRTTHVPGCWESQFSDLRGWAGTAIYERTFDLPHSFLERRLCLRFDAVDYFTEVWVNGQFVGKHEGGYTPFTFDIQTVVDWDGENTIVVRVTDCTPDQDVPLPDGSGMLSFAEIPHGKQSWYTPISGIWQSVTIEARAHTSIEHVHIWPDVDNHTAHVRVSLSSAAVQSDAWKVLLRVHTPEGAETIGDHMLEVPAGHTDTVLELPVPNARLWSPEEPNLYHVTATLLCDRERVDEFFTHFGMRKIETRDGHVWLNGQPYFVIGALDQAFYPRTIYTAPSTEYLRKQFLQAKEMGLNLMRCHIKVPSRDYLDLCDELGLLVWYEVPNGQLLSRPMRQRVRQLFVEMLERDGNHPCIVIKSIMNESWGIDLAEAEQRSWLIETYHWAKSLAPDKLIVDNSACIPNFHVISDLDDYHVYFNVPDRAQEFSEWINAFADRDAGSYSGFGDATRRRNEPLLISEFGNWGLPHHDKLVEAEGGVPWWFETGEGITRPHGVLARFQKQQLGRAFRDYNALADSSQEQEWLALKYQIEEMRRRREVGGYVITEFTDINWESNGLLDMGRNPKVFYDRLPALQQQDLLIPRAERHSYWCREVVRIPVQLSKFSGRDTTGSTLTWRLNGREGHVQVGPTPNAETSHIATLEFSAPDEIAPVKHHVEIELRSADGDVIGRTYEAIVFVPTAMRDVGRNRRVWLNDPLNAAPELASALETVGFKVLSTPETGALAITTQWDGAVNAFVQDGGRAILAALHAKSLQVVSGLGLLLYDRIMNNWWGDWCSSHTWFVPQEFPHLPDTGKFGFEYETVIPQRVLSGSTAGNVLSGLFVGWLHFPAAYVVRLPVGKGKMVATTYEFANHLGDDPISTLLLTCLVEQVMPH